MTNDKNNDFGKYAMKGSDIPRQPIFRDLRSTYMEKFGKNNRELAEYLDISPQSCSTLASGSDKRQPAWYIIMRLLESLDLELVLQSDKIHVRSKDT